MKLRRSAKVKPLAVAILALCLAASLWLLLRPDPLMQGARRLVDGYRSGDGASMASALSSAEIGCSALTPEKLEAAWALLLKPHIERSRFLSRAKTERSDNGLQATSEYEAVDGNGNAWTLQSLVTNTDDGPKAAVFFHMFLHAATFDATGQARPNAGLKETLEAIDRYAPQLKRIGIERVMLNPSRCLTWEELRAFHAEAREKEIRAGNASPKPGRT